MYMGDFDVCCVPLIMLGVVFYGAWLFLTQYSSYKLDHTTGEEREMWLGRLKTLTFFPEWP